MKIGTANVFIAETSFLPYNCDFHISLIFILYSAVNAFLIWAAYEVPLCFIPWNNLLCSSALDRQSFNLAKCLSGI